MPRIRELVNPADLIGVVRELTFPRFRLASLFPRRDVGTLNYSAARSSDDTLGAAPFRARDAESKIGKRAGLITVTGELPPISQKVMLTESDRLMLEGLYSDSDVPADLIDALFADAARMVRSVEARLEIARGDALVDGIITIAENGLAFTIDYGVPAAHKVTAAATWANPATDILGDLRAWVNVYVDTNGAPPGRALASNTVIGYMQLNDAIRTLAGNIIGTPSFVNPETLNVIMQANGLPPIEAYDVQLRDSAGTKARVVPVDRFIMVPAEDDDIQLGETQYGPTAEALELAAEAQIEPSDVPGITAVSWRTKDPVAVWTKGVAHALPVIKNPNYLFTADVTP